MQTAIGVCSDHAFPTMSIENAVSSDGTFPAMQIEIGDGAFPTNANV